MIPDKTLREHSSILRMMELVFAGDDWCGGGGCGGSAPAVSKRGVLLQSESDGPSRQPGASFVEAENAMNGQREDGAVDSGGREFRGLCCH